MWTLHCCTATWSVGGTLGEPPSPAATVPCHHPPLSALLWGATWAQETVAAASRLTLLSPGCVPSGSTPSLHGRCSEHLVLVRWHCPVFLWRGLEGAGRGEHCRKHLRSLGLSGQAGARSPAWGLCCELFSARWASQGRRKPAAPRGDSAASSSPGAWRLGATTTAGGVCAQLTPRDPWSFPGSHCPMLCPGKGRGQLQLWEVAALGQSLARHTVVPGQ